MNVLPVQVRRWANGVKPAPGTLRDEALAGLPGAISSVPDGMASAVLAGVSPIHGLYASLFGPLVGGLSASTQVMVVTTTTASALAAGSAIVDVAPGDRAAALFLLTIMAGALMVVAGILRLGRYTRFVSHSVMIGFLTGVAVNIVLGQLADLAGVEDVHGSISLTKAIYVLFHPGEWNLAALACGVTAFLIMLGLARTKLATVSALIALLVPTVACLVFGADSVLTVSDSGDIPRGFPVPGLPEFRLISLSLIGGAFAVAAIVLVQGAGVAESAPNPDGSASEVDHDFVAQGAANIASGFFKGMTVGGSIGQTALNRTAGARSRWAGIFSGIWMLLIILVFSGLVKRVVMPTLAAVLIYAAIGAIRPREMLTVLRTGSISQIAIVSTFVATLLLPVATAVGLGVVISLLLQINREALDLSVVELEVGSDGELHERPAPERLHDRTVTLLDVYGSLFYAGAKTLEARLPDPSGASEAVVVLRLRGRTLLGATAFVVLSRYANDLSGHGGRLYLSGVDPDLVEQYRRSGRNSIDDPVRLFEATGTVGGSSRAALADAEEWLVQRVAETDDGDQP